MSQFQSLFVKCQECQQRPATIKCFQHNTVMRLCYSCDQAASRISNHSRKTEIIPYQEMYVKTATQQNFKKDLTTSDSQKQFLSTGKNSRAEEEPHQVMYQTQKNYRQNNADSNEQLYPSRAQPKKSEQDYVSSTYSTGKAQATKDVVTQNYKKSPSQPVKKDSIPQAKNLPPQRQDYLLKDESFKRAAPGQESELKNQRVQAVSSTQALQAPQQQVQTQEIKQQIKDDLNKTKDAVEQELQKKQKQHEAKAKQLQSKINEVQKQLEEAKKQSTKLTKEQQTLQQKSKQQESVFKDQLDKQAKQYQKAFDELSEQLGQKQTELDDIMGEMQNYNFEQIQNAFEMMSNELVQKDEFIQQLQQQIQETQDNENDNQENGKDEDDDDLNQLNEQIEVKDTELKKLEELIENFKSLYSHMNDEKQVMIEENEKLQGENEQFRDIFQQNIHLFGIDPNQLQEGQEENGEQENEEGYQEQDYYGYQEGEIIEENDQEND